MMEHSISLTVSFTNDAENNREIMQMVSEEFSQLSEKLRNKLDAEGIESKEMVYHKTVC